MSKEGKPNQAVLEARKRSDTERTALVDRRVALKGELDKINADRVAGQVRARVIVKEIDEIAFKLDPTGDHPAIELTKAGG